MIEEYKNKLKEIEDKVFLLLKDMKIKFDVNTFLHFDALNVKPIDMFNFEIKILASENYTDMSEYVEKINRQGIKTEGYKNKNTRHNIFFISATKVRNLKKEDLEEKISNAMELVFLYQRYKALREEIKSTFELRFSKQRIYLYLSLLDREYFEEKASSRDDFKEYLDFEKFICELKDKDSNIKITRDEFLSKNLKKS